MKLTIESIPIDSYVYVVLHSIIVRQDTGIHSLEAIGYNMAGSLLNDQ